MSMGYNKVILVGNLTRDPAMSYLPNNTSVTELGIAVNRKWRDKDGQQKEDVCFVDCRAYGRMAEVLHQYCHKGDPLLLDGRLQFSSWEGKDGTKRSKLRVVIENFQFLGGDRPTAHDADPHEQAPGANTPPPPAEAKAPSGDEIPF